MQSETLSRSSKTDWASLLRANPSLIDQIDPLLASRLLTSWRFWGRPEQQWPDGDWRSWLILGGRGWGKTRTGAEMVREAVKRGYRRIALVGRTAADVNGTMIAGESGILSVCAGEGVEWVRTDRLLRWPCGAIATAYSADKPDQLRGPQHDFAWPDEPAAWRYPSTMDHLDMGLRLGRRHRIPRKVQTTTPRSTRAVRDLLARADIVTRGSTWANTENLPPAWIADIKRLYEGTSLGRQEIDGEILDRIDGALWTADILDAHRVLSAPLVTRIAVGVDIATTSTQDSDETGIVVVALGADGHGYVLEDLSGRYTPDRWAEIALDAAHDWDADAIVVETNRGGDLIATTLRLTEQATAKRRNRPRASIVEVTASAGKRTRAEPVSALWEQGRAHCVGVLPQLEDTLTTWVPGLPSPDRMDAMVWAAWYAWSPIIRAHSLPAASSEPAALPGPGRRSGLSRLHKIR